MVNRFTARISDKKLIAEQTYVLSLDCDSLEFQPGQFITFVLKDKEGKPKPRSYSLLNAPSRSPVQLLVEFIEGGVAGNSFKEATPETEFTILGPLGKFYFQPEHKKHILIATNTGLAPMHAMIAEYLDKGHDITLIMGAKTKDRLFFHEDFVTLDASDNTFTYKPIVSRETHADIPQGHVQSLIEFDTKAQYYICGSPSMVDDTIKVLEEHNIPTEHIHYEKF